MQKERKVERLKKKTWVEIFLNSCSVFYFKYVNKHEAIFDSDTTGIDSIHECSYDTRD